MSNNIKNITKSVSNTASAATGVVALAADLLIDGTDLVSNGVHATPAVLKALLSAPFAAAKGYLMEAEGMSADEAELAAYRYIKQDVSLTITEVSEGAGKLVAGLFDEYDEDDNNVDSVKKEERKVA